MIKECGKLPLKNYTTAAAKAKATTTTTRTHHYFSSLKVPHVKQQHQTLSLSTWSFDCLSIDQ